MQITQEWLSAASRATSCTEAQLVPALPTLYELASLFLHHVLQRITVKLHGPVVPERDVGRLAERPLVLPAGQQRLVRTRKIVEGLADYDG